MTISPEEACRAVRRYYALVDSGDIDGLLALFHENASYQRPGYAALTGHAELRDFYRSQRIIAHGRHDIGRLVVAGHTVVVRASFAGVLKDGREVSVRFADFFELSDEARFLERETFFFAPSV
ncbi:nuclear transport factor 2 family protein [Amycolatopsis sp. lyj-346]|uniref:nuclear transport factor 2 family protein n=1 Tax=Amycolatopsis sp. lyj-346 TaxID=2789289 RepID=UPI0039783809